MQSPHASVSIAGFGMYAGGDGRIRTADRGFADPRLNHLATSPCCYNALVPRRRLELLQPCGHSALNAACLPIPPPRPAHGVRLRPQSGWLLNRAVVADATIIANETRYVHTLRQKAFYHQRIRFSIPANFCQSPLDFRKLAAYNHSQSFNRSERSSKMPNIRFTPPRTWVLNTRSTSSPPSQRRRCCYSPCSQMRTTQARSRQSTTRLHPQAYQARRLFAP